MASVFERTDEQINGLKLMRLIVDGGTEALKNTFTKIYPGNLQVVLSCTRSYNTLCKLKHNRIINQDQWDILYPPKSQPPNINNFDITLLFVLLRNICNLSPPASSAYWNRMPIVTDHSREADIIRIKLFRNKRFGHISNTTVSLSDFNTFWAEISSPLVRLGIDQIEVDRLKNDLCGEEVVERLLKKWNDMKETLTDVLNQQLVRCNFKAEIDFYNDKFTEGTREWVFKQISTWFDDENSTNRAFVISSLAGMGKSVIAAVVCSRFLTLLMNVSKAVDVSLQI